MKKGNMFFRHLHIITKFRQLFQKRHYWRVLLGSPHLWGVPFARGSYLQKKCFFRCEDAFLRCEDALFAAKTRSRRSSRRERRREDKLARRWEEKTERISSQRISPERVATVSPPLFAAVFPGFQDLESFCGVRGFGTFENSLQQIRFCNTTPSQLRSRVSLWMVRYTTRDVFC